MAAQHNLYLEPFYPKNTISCGAAARYSQYVGPLENAFLSNIKYAPGPPEATQNRGGPVPGR